MVRKQHPFVSILRDKVSGAKGRVFLNMLTLFANYAQPKFPYRFKGGEKILLYSLECSG